MIFKAVVFFAVVLAVADAIVCPPNYCSKVNCEDLTDCLESNGQKIKEKGSFCSCCDICVKILGEGERCQPIGEFLGVIITSECAEGLVCDFRTRRCTKEGVGY